MKLFLWFWYLGGWFFSIYKRANLSASSEFTPWQSTKAYLRAHQAQIAFNFFITTAAFWTVWQDPTVISRAMSAVGGSVLPASWAWVANVNIPLNIFTSAGFGLVSDVLTDFAIAKIVNKFRKSGMTGD